MQLMIYLLPRLLFTAAVAGASVLLMRRLRLTATTTSTTGQPAAAGMSGLQVRTLLMTCVLAYLVAPGLAPLANVTGRWTDGAYTLVLPALGLLAGLKKSLNAKRDAVSVWHAAVKGGLIGALITLVILVAGFALLWLIFTAGGAEIHF